MVKLCFVCLGNICRSPTADGIMHHLVETKGFSGKILVDSAGTGGWHAGEKADPRSRKTAEANGVKLQSIARKFVAEDFRRFDYILAMDRNNRRDILDIAQSEDDENKVYLFRSFDPQSAQNAEVPDPYYGGESGFQDVFDICMRGCEGLLTHLVKEYGL